MFYTELAYVFGLLFMAFGAAFAELSGFGLSMVVAPAYILHLQISKFLPWFTFGVAEYCVQGFIVVLLAIIMRRFRLLYLLSFATALIYGALLDGAMWLISPLSADMIPLRLLWFVLGTIFCAVAVSLFFHTYLPPESYELIVKELSNKFSFDIHKTKTAYDCISLLTSVVLSFMFFGFGVFKGVGIGTVICALINGSLIGRITKKIEQHFCFVNKFNVDRFFDR